MYDKGETCRGNGCVRGGVEVGMNAEPHVTAAFLRLAFMASAGLRDP